MIFVTVKLLNITSRSYKSCKSFYSQGFLIKKNRYSQTNTVHCLSFCRRLHVIKILRRTIFFFAKAMNKYTVINRSLRRKSKKTNKRAELTLVKYNCFVNLFRSRE